MGVMRIALRKIFRRAPGGKLILRTVTGETSAVLHRGVQQGRVLPVTPGAVDHGLGVQMIGIAGVQPGGEHLLDHGHVLIFWGSPGDALTDQSKVLSGHIAVAGDALQMKLRARMGEVYASREPVLLRLSGLPNGVTANAGGQSGATGRGVSLG